MSDYRYSTVKLDTAEGIREINIDTELFSQRKLSIEGEVTPEMADDFRKKMLILTQEDQPIDIYINSPGGSVVAGLAIYDIIQACKDFEINMYCVGHAASMGAILLAGGQKGRRFIAPHSEVMIHEPLIQSGAGGSATSIMTTAKSINETKNLIADILVEHTGRTKKEINKAISFDNFMNAKEAVEFGICDEIRNIF